MTRPTIDAELTEQDLAAVAAQFASILEPLRFLVGVSPEQCKRDIQGAHVGGGAVGLVNPEHACRLLDARE